MMSCEKTELIECSCDINYSEEAVLAMNGELCTRSGHQVYVVVDTLYYEFVRVYKDDVAVERTEYFYHFNEYGKVKTDLSITLHCN